MSSLRCGIAFASRERAATADRCPPAGPRAGDRRLGPGRRDRRPGSREPDRDAARGPVGGAARAAPHAHPPRPRGRDRCARGAVPRPRGLRARPAARRTWSIPSKLLQSAERIYGDDMGRCGAGSCRCRSATCACSRAARRSASAGAIRRRYTPGHASHHVVYFDRSRRDRLRRGRRRRADPAGRLRARRRRRRRTSTSRPGSARSTSWREREPARLALTHFGMVDDPQPHLARMKQGLDEQAELVRELLERHGDTDEAVAAFVAEVERRTREAVGDELAADVRGRAPRSSSAGSGCGATGRSRRRSRQRDDDGTETDRAAARRRARDRGDGHWRVIVLNDNHNTFDHVAKTLAQRDPQRQHRPGLPLRRRRSTTAAARSCGPASASRPSSTGSSSRTPG